MSDERKPRTEWEDAGIVGEHKFLSLHYNEPADVLLAQFERMVASQYAEYAVYSIYIKRRLDAQYVKIFGPDNVTSAVDVVTAARNPLAFFNVMVASPGSILEGKSTGFNWSHVGQIDLATGSVSVAVAAAMAPQCAFRSVFHGIVLPRRRRAVRAVMEDEIVPALDALGLGASHAWRARRRGS